VKLARKITGLHDRYLPDIAASLGQIQGLRVCFIQKQMATRKCYPGLFAAYLIPQVAMHETEFDEFALLEHIRTYGHDFSLRQLPAELYSPA
jgi:hypothetical protein